MEENSNNSSSPSLSTNWIVSKGSLHNVLTLKTTNGLEKEEDHGKHQSVVLISPTSDSSFCEINVSFAQSHEIRRIYVRSSARTYEIYCKTGQQSSNEYLCGASCSITKENRPLDTSDVEELTFAWFKGSKGSTNHMELPETQTGIDNTPNEDDWVEVESLDSALLDSETCSLDDDKVKVQVPDSELLDTKISSLDDKVDRDTERSFQGCYEATTEITDSSPCITLTIRLLSLHTEGYAHLEEIRIYGEHSEQTDSEDKVDTTSGPAQKSIMDTLTPTLLHLSEGGMTNRTSDEHFANGRPVSLGPYIRTMSQNSESSLPNEEEGRLEEATKQSPESTQIQLYESVPGAGQGSEFANHLNDSSSGRIESVFDQMVRRMESFCLRFEENMLKPIRNIETRLEQLQQKVEVLTMRSQSSESPVASHTVPGLVITAPELSTEDNDNNHNNDIGKNRPDDSESANRCYPVCKPSLSHDNASGTSLTGFLSSTQASSVNHISTLVATDSIPQRRSRLLLYIVIPRVIIYSNSSSYYLY